MKNLKRIAALALTLLAVLSCFTLCIFAEDVTDAATEAVTEPVTEPVTDTTADAPVADTVATVLKNIFSGTNLALLGAALAVALPCMGSAKGVGIVGEAASGLISENPSIFGKALALQALPMTQGVYGLVAAFLMLAMLGLFGDTEHLITLPINAGAYYLMASLPIALSGYFSAVRQGRVSAAGINLLSKRPAESGKAITSSALVETYAIFALLVTLLLVFFSPFNA
ncbi:MAG: V-type ATP synthase subunit K [Clostridia bacterium]|nr:V-type ATP synthase subunit K [Clostridia bacterium]